ncbi:MAG: hypothetical protein J6Y97_00770 [Prevotella sp.]|nr:hypothetical protein [Prevotella sp.]
MMEEPRIDPQLHKDSHVALRPFLVAGVPILILLLAVVLSFFQGCTALGKVSNDNLYDPSSEVGKDEGFVGKANLLLRELVADVDNSVSSTCLDSLNRHYPALEFALPYAEAHKPYIEASDLRLVAIHPERIKDESLREFFFNSRLPQLLQRQGEQLDETYFRIRCRGVDSRVNHTRPIEVKSIELLPSMFKVALAKNPWTGIIMGAPNSLFCDSDAVFLTYGNSVLPLHNEPRLTRDNPLQFHAVMGEGTLKGAHGDIDYYDYYLRTFKSDEVHSINIDLREQENTRARADFMLCYSHDTLLVSHSTDLMVIGEGKAKMYRKPETGSQRPSSIPFVDGMKLLVYDDEERKLGEFVIQRQDPSSMLSCLVQSNMGTSRFFIDPSQTDLFTQQMLRGLSRHLSNRDNVSRVDLSIDPLLSKEFEHEVTNYVHHLQDAIGRGKPRRQTKEQYDMSVTIMDMATGQVLATPFYTSLFDFDDYPEAMKMTVRNTSLSRRSVGSTFKPLVALPAVLSNPNLLDMNTASPHRYHWDGKSSDVDFFGRRTHLWAKKSSTHWSGCDFTTFLSRSDDVYPVALAALAMTNERLDASVTTLPVDGTNNFFTLSNGRTRYLMFRRAEDTQTINQRNRYFTDWLSYLYNTSYDNDYVNDLNLFKGLFVNDSLNMDQKHFGLDEITPEYTDLRLDRFYDGDDFHHRLVPWTLGQGDNMWNCIKVAEAWCRMVSKRQVNASFIKQRGDSLPSLIQAGPDYPGSVFGERSVSNINSTWNTFLDKLHDAQQSGGLLSPMRNRVVELNQREHTQLTLFSKTGTPDSYIRYEFPMLGGNNRYVDIGMYSFALMDNEQYENRVQRNLPAKGVVCVVRITRSYQCNQCRPGRQCSACEDYLGLQSSHARNFFSDSATRLQKFYEMTKNYY